MSAALTPRQRHWLVGGGVLALLLGVGTWLVIRDDPPPDDADLLVTVPSPSAPGSSVIALLGEIVAALPAEGHWKLVPERREDGSSPWAWELRPLDRAAWSDPETVELDRAHFEEALRPLDRVAEALASDRSVWEAVEPWEFPSPGLRELERVAGELGERALWRRVQGDVPAASRDLELALRITSRILENAPADFSTAMPAGRVHAATIQRFESLLHDDDLDPGVESRIIGTSPALSPERGTLRRAILLEYRRLRASLLHGATRGGTLPRFAYKPNRTVRGFADLFREALTEVQRSPCDRSERVEPTSESNGALLRRALLRLNSGEILLDGQANVFWIPIEQLERTCSQENALRLLLALRRYERLHGTLPPDLGALLAAVPELGSLPRDPYSGEPLRYDPARRIFWSVGIDGVDDGAPGWELMVRTGIRPRSKHPLDVVWWVPAAPQPASR